MIIHNFAQHTEEWYNIRKGKFTCSTLSDLFMDKKTKGYNEAINKVVFERLTGEIPESFQNDYMRRGTELEPYARERYEMETFNIVQEVGFIDDGSGWFGYSPDGLLNEDGLIEIKCPKFSTLIDFALTRKIPKEYMLQMQGGMLVSDRKYCDFICFHPKMGIITETVKRDEIMIGNIREALLIAIDEVKKRLDKLK
jgi:putative phage-type endonuclease